MNTEIIKNTYGYFEVRNKPSPDELQEYYANKYYQNGLGSYETHYGNDEKQYFLNKIEQKFSIAKKILSKGNRVGKILDIGAGEGFTLKFFDELGWSCKGLDFSDFGIQHNNPKQQELLITGDIFKNIEKIIANNEKFDLIWLDNVLEHVINPLELLSNLKIILNARGVMVVDVPNDFSIIQQYLLNKKYIDKEFWVCAPDHLSYFNKEGLEALAKEAGWQLKKTISDYPIDLDLLSVNSNYVNNKALGKVSHTKRIEFENLIHSISVEKTNQFYESLADLGLGRNIVSFFTLT